MKRPATDCVLATDWVEPGKGCSAGYLWDLAINSPALRHNGAREDFLSRGILSDSERARRTRLSLSSPSSLSCLYDVPLQEYDIDRIIAAIWEFEEDNAS